MSLGSLIITFLYDVRLASTISSQFEPGELDAIKLFNNNVLYADANAWHDGLLELTLRAAPKKHSTES